MLHHPTTIAFYGSSLVSAYWNGAATYYRGVIKNLHQLGYRTTFFEPDAYERQQHRDMEPPEWCKVVVYNNSNEAALQAIQQAKNFDIVVKASGVGVFDELLERELVRRRQAGQVIIFWDVDAPATLGRMDDNAHDPFREMLPYYDAVFTYGGGQPVIDRYTAFGAQQCVPVYNALDPDTHHPAEDNKRFQADLGFLGNRLPDREARVEEFFLRAAELAPEKEFIIGGSGWESRDLPDNVKHLGHVYTAEHNSFNCTPLAVLNISRESMASNGFSPATRVFEAAGAGACLITDFWEGIENFLEPGEEVLVAHNGAEVAEMLQKLTPERATTIGEAARKRVLAEHTYAQRAEQLKELFSELLTAQKQAESHG